MLVLKDITSDKKLVEILDELSHQLKSIKTPLGLRFRGTLHQFFSDENLDHDQHNFATLPPENAKNA